MPIFSRNYFNADFHFQIKTEPRHEAGVPMEREAIQFFPVAQQDVSATTVNITHNQESFYIFCEIIHEKFKVFSILQKSLI
jgi:hypothetical protein